MRTEPTPEEALADEAAVERLFDPNSKRRPVAEQLRHPAADELVLMRTLARWFPEEFAKFARKSLESASGETRDRLRRTYEVEARCAAAEKARRELLLN